SPDHAAPTARPAAASNAANEVVSIPRTPRTAMKRRTWSRTPALPSTYDASVASSWRRCRKRLNAARTSLMTQLPMIHNATAPRSFHAVGIKYTRANASTCAVNSDSTESRPTHGQCQPALVTTCAPLRKTRRRESKTRRYMSRNLAIRRGLDSVELGILTTSGHQGLVRSHLYDAG